MDRMTKEMLRTVAKLLVPILNEGVMTDQQRARVKRAYRSIILALQP